VLSDCAILHDAKEKRMRLRGIRRKELQPNDGHERDVNVSPENDRKTRMLMYDGTPTLVTDGIHWCGALRAPLVVYIVITE